MRAKAPGETGSLPDGGAITDPALSYAGVDARGIPHYATIPVSRPDSTILRRAYGIVDPHRLYVSDSSAARLLKYDTERKRCRTCYVNSYRVGYVSVRRPGESWDHAEQRVRNTPAQVFAAGAHTASSNTAGLDPAIRPIVVDMLRKARVAGFHIRVTATYRSPVREAYLMASGSGRTHTLTSNHSYGRAIDIAVDDGNRANTRTRSDWIAFRRWVTHFPTGSGESFRVLGGIEYTWDWAHIELPSTTLGFKSIQAAVARGRECLGTHATITCNFLPHLPPHLRDRLVHQDVAAPVERGNSRHQ